MVALKAAQIDAFMARLKAAPPIVLVFGPDSGLVRERAEKLILASVDDPKDPFSLARLEGDDLAANPTHLSRTGFVFIGNQTLIVSQDPAPCTNTLGFNSANYSYVLTNDAVSVNTLTGCVVTAVSGTCVLLAPLT